MTTEFTSRRLTQLKKIDIEKPSDLLLNLPIGYDNFVNPLKSIAALRRLEHGHSFYATLKLVDVRLSDDINREKASRGERFSDKPYVAVDLTDGISKITSYLFTGSTQWVELKKQSQGQVIHFHGKVKHRNSMLNLDELQVVPASDVNKIVARYRGRKGVITPQTVADSTKIAIQSFSDEAVEDIVDRLNEDEASILKSALIGFRSLKQLLFTLHMPKTAEDLERAITGAKNLNAYSEIRKAILATERQPSPASAIPVNRELITRLVKEHPYTPTTDQARAIWTIVKNLGEETPMDRLLSADVGNGKTLAYGIPAAYVCTLGGNVVILLPTEPLAGQVASNLRSWYPELNIHLVTAGFNDTVVNGSMLIGTTAVLTWLENNPHWKASLAITDEQQKMGTAQRDALTSSGTHTLEATATPIARTMAQTIFGSKKVTTIRDCPVKKSITTTLLGNSREDKLKALNQLRACVQKGKKIAVIYPLVAEQQAYVFHIEADSAKDAEKTAKLMKAAGLTLQMVIPTSDATELLTELDEGASGGFVAVMHGEGQDFARLQKRFAKYMGEAAESCRYLGSRVDDDLAQKNRKTIESAAQLWEKLYPGRVAVIHGRSKREAKAQIIDFMNNGGADVLLSTTLIEIGIDIKDLFELMVVGAENMGAFTLHQLRGRVARHGGEGGFIMMAGCPAEDIDPVAKARMELLVKYTSGEDIALHDMEQRGFGDLRAGGQAQKGFDDALFPGLKITTADLDNFAMEYTRAQKARSQPAAMELGMN